MTKNWKPAESGFTFYFELASNNIDTLETGGFKITVEGLDPMTSDEALTVFVQQLIESDLMLNSVEDELDDPVFIPVSPELFYYLYEYNQGDSLYRWLQ